MAAPGFQFDPSTASVSITEGESKSFRIRLTEVPTGDVTVSVRSSDTTALAVATSSLTFTTSNFNTYRTVYLAAEQDSDKVSESVTVTVAASGGGYGNVSSTFTYAVTDNDSPALELETRVWWLYGKPAALELAGPAWLGIRLSQLPTGPVTVAVGSADAAVATAGPATLRFTRANWDRVQHFSVTATSDANTTDDETNILFTASGGGFDNVTASMEFKAVDTIGSEIIFDREEVYINEDAAPTSFPVRLASAPPSDVTVTVTSNNTGAATVDADPATAGNQGSFTFTTTNWNVPRRITVNPVEDANTSRDTATITFAFGGKTSTMTVYVRDADTTPSRFTVAPTVVKVQEGGTATFTIGMTHAPTGDVTISNWNVSGRDDSKDSAVTVSPSTLTFTTQDWNQRKTVTLTGVQDADDDNESVLITFDSSGGGFSVSSYYKYLYAMVVDDDAATSSAGVVISPARMTLVEGASSSFSVRLASKPSDDVKFAISESGDFPRGNGVGVAAGGISYAVFTPTNWNVPQSMGLTLSWYDGADPWHPLHAGNDRTVEIEIAGYRGAREYMGVSAKMAMTAVPASEPALAASPDRLALNVGETSGVNVSLSRMPTGTVTVSAASSATGTATVGSSSLTFTPANWNIAQLLTVASGTSGSANVNLSASGGDYGSASLAVPVVVSAGSASPGVSVDLDRLVIKEGFGNTLNVRLATQPAGAVTVGVARSTSAVTLSRHHAELHDAELVHDAGRDRDRHRRHGYERQLRRPHFYALDRQLQRRDGVDGSCARHRRGCSNGDLLDAGPPHDRQDHGHVQRSSESV